jgi:outer membrane phospholipase A
MVVYNVNLPFRSGDFGIKPFRFRTDSAQLFLPLALQFRSFATLNFRMVNFGSAHG